MILVKKMEEDLDQNRILKVFNLVDWKEVPQADIKWIEDKASKMKLENVDIIEGQTRIHDDEIVELRKTCQDRCERLCENNLSQLNKDCNELNRRLSAFEQQMAHLNEKTASVELDIKEIKAHIQNKKRRW